MPDLNSNQTKTLNFFVEKGSKNFDSRVKEKCELAPFHIDESDAKYLECFIRSLPEKTKFYIWFHLDVKSKMGADQKKKGELVAIKFQDKFPGLTSFLFVTTGTGLSPHGICKKYDEIKNFIAGQTDDFIDPYTPQMVFNPDPDPVPYKFEMESTKNINYEALIGKTTIKKILGKLLVSRYKTQKENWGATLKFLVPGYSGASLIKLTYLNPDDDEIVILLKVNKNKESIQREIAPSELLSDRNLPNNYLKLNPSYEYFEIDGYLCLVYHYQPYKTLMSFLQKNYPDFSNRVLYSVLKGFRVFDEKIGNCQISKFNPWKGSHLHIGLKPAQWVFNYFEKNLSGIITSFPESFLEEQYDLNVDSLNKLVSELSSIDFHQSGIIEMPVSRIHGDLHARNILVSEKGKDPYYIDFALLDSKKKRVALLDLAKLCVDIETNVIPDHLLIPYEVKTKAETNIDIREWNEIHRQFLYNSEITITDNRLSSIYKLAKQIFKEAIARYNKRELKIKRVEVTKIFGKKKIAYLFHLARLREFVKIIAYDDILREKKFFVIRTCIDIVVYIKKTQKELG